MSNEEYITPEALWVAVITTLWKTANIDARVERCRAVKQPCGSFDSLFGGNSDSHGSKKQFLGNLARDEKLTRRCKTKGINSPSNTMGSVAPTPRAMHTSPLPSIPTNLGSI